MLRRTMTALLGALSFTAVIGVAGEANAAEVLKIGTLAPKSSPSGQVFTVWAKAVTEKSGGRLELQFFFNGQLGDEGAMVGKMKSGQLDGAALSGAGLGKIYKPILALQMPGLFSSWAKLDAARDALNPEFEAGIRAAGFTLTGWGNDGVVRIMSKGFAIKTSDDFKSQKPFMWRDDLIQPKLYQQIGGVTPVPLNIPEVLPQLNTGAVNIVFAAALTAEQLQWASKLDNIVDHPTSFAIGALVLSSKRLDALPPELRQIVLDTGKVAANALTTRIRNEDAAAYSRMKGKMTVITLTEDEKAKWQALFQRVRQALVQGTFTPELVAKLEALAG